MGDEHYVTTNAFALPEQDEDEFDLFENRDSEDLDK